MGDVIQLHPMNIQPRHENVAIDTSRITIQKRKLEDGAIQPASESIVLDIAPDHTSEPIKRIEDIERISQFLIDQKRYRDNMLFIVGINFGLRVSDLLQLRFYNLIDESLTFRTTFPILEKKTRNTRKVQRNRYITINDAVVEAVTLYLQHNKCRLDDYLFKGESNRCGTQNAPMARGSVDRILKGIAKDLNLGIKISTHSLRKTFGYHQMMMSGNDQRKLLVLQKMFGHSSSAVTLDYIGITTEEITDAYMQLNLGGMNPYYSRCNTIGESNVTA